MEAEPWLSKLLSCSFDVADRIDSERKRAQTLSIRLLSSEVVRLICGFDNACFSVVHQVSPIARLSYAPKHASQAVCMLAFAIMLRE